MTAYLLAALAAALGAAWAFWERGRRIAAEARTRLATARAERAEAAAELAANGERAAREDAADQALRAAAAARVTTFDLEVCRDEIPRLIGEMAPADAARAAGDLLERSLQRAREARTAARPPIAGALMPAVRPAADADAGGRPER